VNQTGDESADNSSEGGREFWGSGSLPHPASHEEFGPDRVAGYTPQRCERRTRHAERQGEEERLLLL